MGYILVVDPAITTFAYAVFSQDGNVLESKTIKNSSKDSQESRLYKLFKILDDLPFEFDIIICEKQFVEIMTQIVGTVRTLAGKKGIKTVCFVPASWRKLATGKGNAKEDLVKETVLKHYPEFEDKSEHEIDTIALYLAYKASLTAPPKIKKPKKKAKNEKTIEKGSKR